MEHLTHEQLHDLLSVARTRSERDWLLILTSYWHGLRASEAIALTPSRIRDGFLSVRRLKGSNKTTQPLVSHSDPLLDEKAALTALASAKRKSERLFPITRQAFGQKMHQYGKAAGLPIHLCHPHVLKHTIAMHAIRAAGIEHVRQYLGHVSMQSTGEYLKVSDAEASAAVQSVLTSAVG
jgi:integrase